MGDVGKALMAGKTELARERARYWMDLYPDSYYLELQRTGRPGDEDCLHLSVELAGALGLPVVATNDVHFLEAEDFEAHEARVCIGESRTLDDPRRDRRFSDQHTKSVKEHYAAKYPGPPDTPCWDVRRKEFWRKIFGYYMCPQWSDQGKVHSSPCIVKFPIFLLLAKPFLCYSSPYYEGWQGCCNFRSACSIVARLCGCVSRHDAGAADAPLLSHGDSISRDGNRDGSP